MLLLSSHPHWVALALKPPAWKPGEPKKTTRRHLHLYIHLQPPARVPDPGLGVGLLVQEHCPCPSPWPCAQPKLRGPVCQHWPLLADSQNWSHSTGRCASPGRPAPILRQSSASPFLRWAVSSSGSHQHPSPSNPSESWRKPPQASTEIPCPLDTGMARRGHRSHMEIGRGDEQDTRSPLNPRN